MARAPTIDDAMREAEAAKLRAEGLTYPQIGAVQGVDTSTAHRRVKRALRSVPVEAVNELRQIEDARLDEMFKVAWELLHEDHTLWMASKDGPVDCGVDYDLKLRALDKLLGISKRRSDVWGIDTIARERLGLDLRALEIEQAKLDLVAKALEAAMGELGLPDEQWRGVVGKHLRALEAGESV